MEDGLLPGLSGKCKVHSLFIVSRHSIEVQLSIQGLLIVIENSARKACLGTVKSDWTCVTAWQWTNRKHFLFWRGNIRNTKVASNNKTTWLLSHRSFNNCYSCLVLYLHSQAELSQIAKARFCCTLLWKNTKIIISLEIFVLTGDNFTMLNLFLLLATLLLEERTISGSSKWGIARKKNSLRLCR